MPFTVSPGLPKSPHGLYAAADLAVGCCLGENMQAEKKGAKSRKMWYFTTAVFFLTAQRSWGREGAKFKGWAKRIKKGKSSPVRANLFVHDA
jgi:hypothetical protein